MNKKDNIIMNDEASFLIPPKKDIRFIKNLNCIELAEWLHNNYEEIAIMKNWNTQKSCKVPFQSLPSENQQVMIWLAQRIMINLLEGVKGLEE